jgi:hypothetical protein
VVLRDTNLIDDTHVALARKFGELDDVKPYIAAGRKNRLKYDELFDVSNVEEDGSIVDPGSPRGQANKVGVYSTVNLYFILLISDILGKWPFSCRFKFQSSPRELLPFASP